MPAPPTTPLTTLDDIAFSALGDWDDYRPSSPVEDESAPNPTTVDPRKPTDEATALDERIAALEAQLAAARLEKEKLLDRHALVARLPDEVLARVFELSVHETPAFLYTLYLVSALWRRTALATPVLSSYIVLDNTVGYGRTARFVEHAQLLLQRSGARALHVDLDCRYTDSLAELEQVMQALGPHLRRAFVFRASVPDWEWLGAVRTAAAELGPALEALYVRIDPTDNDDVEPAPFLPPERAYPRLHSVVLEHAPLLCVRHAALPALTSLYLSRDQRYHSSSRMSVSLREVLAVLAAYPTLTKLRLQGVRFHLDGSECAFGAAGAPPDAPALAELTLHHVGPADASVLLASVGLPALRRLALHMENSDEPSLAFLAAVLAGRPAALPALRALDVRNMNVDGPALFPLVQALRALPRLTALGICSPPSCTVGGRLFDLLARPAERCEPGGSRWLAPRLQALCVQNARDVSGHEVLRVLRARAGSGTLAGADGAPADLLAQLALPPECVAERIRMVRLNQCFGVEEDMMESIRDMVDVLKN